MSEVRQNQRMNKARMCDELLNIVSDLSVSQTEILLRQALSLAGETEKDDRQSIAIQRLSQREIEVLVLVANGYNRKNIGITLGISVNTAARHIANIYAKLEVSTVAEATCFAYNTNVVGSLKMEDNCDNFVQ